MTELFFLRHLACYFELYYTFPVPVRYYNCSQAVTSIILPHLNTWVVYLIMKHSPTTMVTGLGPKEGNLHSLRDAMKRGGNDSNNGWLRSQNCDGWRTIYMLFHAVFRFVSFYHQIHSVGDTACGKGLEKTSRCVRLILSITADAGCQVKDEIRLKIGRMNLSPYRSNTTNTLHSPHGAQIYFHLLKKL